MDTIGIEIKKDAWAVARVTEGMTGPKVADSFVAAGSSPEERLRRVSDYISEKGLKDPFISVCLPRGASLVKAVEVAAPNQNAVEGILRFELDRHLPVPTEDASFGFAVLGKSKNLYTALLAASPKKEVEGLKGLFAGAGLNGIGVHTWQASVLNALTRCGKAARSRSVISLWIRKDDLVIEAFCANVPVFSRRLKTGGQRPGAWAESVDSCLCFALRSAIGRLGCVEECIVVSDEIPGDGFFMSLQSRLGIPVHAETLEGLGAGAKYAPAIGAALAHSQGGVNAPLSGQSRPRPHGRFNLAVGAAAAVFVLLAGLSYAARDHIALKRLDAALAEASAGRERARRLADEFRQVEGAVSTLRSIDGGAGPNVLEVMGELSALLPDEAWLTGFELNDGAVLIEGYSKNASSLMLRMEGSKVLRDFEFAGPVTRGDDGRERFRIRLKVNGIEERPYGKVVKTIQAKAGN